MRRIFIRTLFMVFAFMVMIKINTYVFASEEKETKSNYEIIILDDADLLSEEEENELTHVMEPITAYGNVAFLTTDENDRTAETYSKNFYREHWGTDSGTVLLIDLSNRKLWIFSDGYLYSVITSNYADTITDNVYKYATNGEYYDCARKVYEQMYSLLSGYKIAQPMKHITNALLAMIMSALIIFVYIRSVFVMKAPSDDELLENIKYHCEINDIKSRFTNQSKRYNPPSTSSSHGGGGHSSGGGGGGGHSSGGGGGHSF